MHGRWCLVDKNINQMSAKYVGVSCNVLFGVWVWDRDHSNCFNLTEIGWQIITVKRKLSLG